ncbi:Holliday junction branch migration protein RuvA [Sporolactobacillus sp. THM7-4]|nr:Holliday junction branch migration protein RuvA [Sporolactobacillus sp. THM7-4]
MFDYIRGVLTYLSSGGIVIEQGGIGYRIICANPFSYQSQIHCETTVYLYQYVREDAIILYGFQTREERELFVRLLSVSGIGPKNALAILATGQPEQIIQAIEAEDHRYLTQFPGIGKKTAGQIILDLKGKMHDFAVPYTSLSRERAYGNEPAALSEAVEALKMLGYSDREIRQVVPVLEKEEMSAERFVKEALRLMTKR